MKFNGLTTWGREHLASVVSNKGTLRLSKVMIGDGSITSSEQALALTQLVGFKKTYPITNIEKHEDIVVVHSAIDNIGLQSGYTAREVGIYVDLDGVDHLFWYINNHHDVTYIHSISNGLLKVDATYQMIYSGDEVSIENRYDVDYFVSKRFMMEYTASFAQVHRGTEPPEEENKLWIDINDPFMQTVHPDDADLVKIVMDTLKETKVKLDEIDYKLSYKLDAGERIPEIEKYRVALNKMLPSEREKLSNRSKFNRSSRMQNDFPPLDPSYPDIDDEYKPNMKEYVQSSLKHLCIARGSRENMGNLLGGEFFLDTDKGDVYIGNGKGAILKVNGGGGGSSNLTGEFLELLSPRGVAYKVRVTDQGKLEIAKSAIDNRPLPDPEDPNKANWDTYKSSDKTGLCINQIYSGGKMNSENTPVSHSFIEIYNNSERDISLRGLSVQYAKIGSDWSVCELDGLLPGNTSYLIRCQQNTNPYKLACRLKITNYDQEWDQELSNTGMKVALVVGTTPLTMPDPYKDPPRIEPIHRYIDMIGVAGAKETETVDYCEGYFARHILDRNTAACRDFREGLKDRDSSLLDIIAIDYRYDDIDRYGPRCRQDGPWDIYRGQINLSEGRPNLTFVTFGKEQSTRIFTWQTKPTREGYVKIKKIANTFFRNGEYVSEDIIGRTQYISFKSTTRNITHHDTSAVKHSVIIKNLTPGIYQYKCGEEGKWSDEQEIEIFHENYGNFTGALLSGEKEDDRNIKILHTSDQQGWNDFEYLAWKYASEFIVTTEKTNPILDGKKPNYHWRVNTGDESQNGNRAYEWRLYYDASKEDLANTVEMSVCGNNDLIDKKKSEAYTYYTSYEDSPYPSCYEYFVGDVHFLCFNAWAHQDTDFKDYPNADSTTEDPNKNGYVNKQIRWLKEKLSGPRKRWTIIVAHVAPYTCVKMANAQPYRDVIEGWGGTLYEPADLFLCGHQHNYTRTKAMLGTRDYVESDGTTTKLDGINPLRGIYHVQCQATGFKLTTGKEKPQPNTRWLSTIPKELSVDKVNGDQAGLVPPNPTYLLWEIAKDYIQLNAYEVDGMIAYDSTTNEYSYNDQSTYKRKHLDSFKVWHKSVRPTKTIEELGGGDPLDEL
ncbi:MAG: metallophosphoesterase [Paraclostridium sp.]